MEGRLIDVSVGGGSLSVVETITGDLKNIPTSSAIMTDSYSDTIIDSDADAIELKTIGSVVSGNITLET